MFRLNTIFLHLPLVSTAQQIVWHAQTLRRARAAILLFQLFTEMGFAVEHKLNTTIRRVFRARIALQTVSPVQIRRIVRLAEAGTLFPTIIAVFPTNIGIQQLIYVLFALQTASIVQIHLHAQFAILIFQHFTMDHAV